MCVTGKCGRVNPKMQTENVFNFKTTFIEDRNQKIYQYIYLC